MTKQDGGGIVGEEFDVVEGGREEETLSEGVGGAAIGEADIAMTGDDDEDAKGVSLAGNGEGGRAPKAIEEVEVAIDEAFVAGGRGLEDGGGILVGEALFPIDDV